MRVGLDSVVFAYDFDRLTTDGLLYDAGPLGLHATPGAGAAAPTRQLDGSYYFDGGDTFNLSGASQTRFYANAPTGALTWLLSCTPTTGAGNVGVVCIRTVGAPHGGIALDYFGATSAYHLYQNKGGGAGEYINASVYAQSGRKHVTVCTVETTPRGISDGAIQTCAWGAGAFGTTVYDPAFVPCIGLNAAVGFFSGRISYLCLLRGSVLSSDLAQLSALMMDGKKPWCYR